VGDHGFEKDSLHDLVDERLLALSDTWLNFGDNHTKKRPFQEETQDPRSRPERAPERVMNPTKGGCGIWSSKT
jgi:hypothetical protein